jgi:DNA-binding transcriptional ArsR family regulator
MGGSALGWSLLDPIIHVSARLCILARLAALPGGDSLCFARLEEMIGLRAGSLVRHLRKLEDAGCVDAEKTGNGQTPRTGVALTHKGNVAFQSFTAALRDLLRGL